jgi:hypothetical protein
MTVLVTKRNIEPIQESNGYVSGFIAHSSVVVTKNKAQLDINTSYKLSPFRFHRQLSYCNRCAANLGFLALHTDFGPHTTRLDTIVTSTEKDGMAIRRN